MASQRPQDKFKKKFLKLRNYHGVEVRKEENSKVSEAGATAVYSSPWRFFGNLSFLRDNLLPHPIISNIERSAESEENNCDFVYTANNPPSTKALRKIRENKKEKAVSVMETASKALECITNTIITVWRVLHRKYCPRFK